MRLDDMTIKPEQRTLLIPLAGLEAQEVEPSIKLLLSRRGQVQSIPSSNSLFIIDSPEPIERIRRFVFALEEQVRRHEVRQKDQPPKEELQRPGESASLGLGKQQLYVKVYNVADLITTDLDDLTPKDFEKRVFASPHDRGFQILVAAINERVAPDSWDTADGGGSVHPFPNNLSLVVLQTQGGHQELAKFLRELRKKLGLTSTEHAKPATRLLAKASPRVFTAGYDTDELKEKLGVPTAAETNQPPRKRSTNIYSRVYNVADLVVPIPPATAKIAKHGSIKGAAVADFNTLIELITSTVAPDTWSEAGGSGAIEDFPTNLSIVVSQTNDVHEQIGELLGQLRKLQDVQVTLEACFVRIPENHFRRLGLVFQTSDGEKSDLGLSELSEGGSVKLTDIEAVFYLKAVQASREASIVAAPKITFSMDKKRASHSLAMRRSKT